MNWLKKIFRRVVKEELDTERAAEESARALRGDDDEIRYPPAWMKPQPIVIQTPRCHTCGTTEKLTQFGDERAVQHGHGLYFCKKCYR